MFRLDRALKPYRESGSLNDQVSLFGFIDDGVFLTKSGDVGLMLAVKGVDYEGLAGGEIDQYTKRLESAFKIFDEKCRVYQYLFKRNHQVSRAARTKTRSSTPPSRTGRHFSKRNPTGSIRSISITPC